MKERKSPTIPFDRTANGEIILPGRWWAGMLHRLSEGVKTTELRRHLAFRASRAIQAPDALLPPDTDTVDFLAPDKNGKESTFEVLPPGGKIVLRVVTRL